MELQGHRQQDAAAAVGALLAQRAKDKGIKAVVFNHVGRPSVHGRVKALGDAARKAGLDLSAHTQTHTHAGSPRESRVNQWQKRWNSPSR